MLGKTPETDNERLSGASKNTPGQSHQTVRRVQLSDTRGILKHTKNII